MEKPNVEKSVLYVNSVHKQRPFLPHPREIHTMKRPLNDASDQGDQVKRLCKTPRKLTRTSAHASFLKPPYTYHGMVVLAIQTHPFRHLTVGAIYNAIIDMFPEAFSGEYQGWRCSVQQSLYRKDCFIRCEKRSVTKTCSWRVDLSKVCPSDFRKTFNDREGKWATTLTAQLGVPEVCLEPQEQDLQTKQAAVHPDDQQPKTPRRRLPFTIDYILRRDTIERQEPPDTKFDHPYSFLRCTVSEVKPKKENPSYGNGQSYASAVYQSVNTPGMDYAETKDYLLPVPNYGETMPFSTLRSTTPDQSPLPHKPPGQPLPLSYSHEAQTQFYRNLPYQTGHTSSWDSSTQMPAQQSHQLPLDFSRTPCPSLNSDDSQCPSEISYVHPHQQDLPHFLPRRPSAYPGRNRVDSSMDVPVAFPRVFPPVQFSQQSGVQTGAQESWCGYSMNTSRRRSSSSSDSITAVFGDLVMVPDSDIDMQFLANGCYNT